MLNELSFAEAAAAIERGDITSEQLVRDCLDRIEARDDDIKAWAYFDPELALAQARACDTAGERKGPLHGVPFGVKDIIATYDMPTGMGSPIYEGCRPGYDAACVALLRAAGAVILGKTVTVEFAGMAPPPTANPHNLACTPGGSSSGSGAALGAGMVPAAIGTQTVASVNRPAAYCGVSAFKPSTRSMSAYGIAPLAPMYDTPGVYGWSVADAVAVYNAVCPPHAHAIEVRDTAPRVLVLDDPFLGEADDEIIAARDRVADQLREAGYTVEHIVSPISMEALNDVQGHTTVYELARVHAALLEFPEDQVGSVLRQAVIDGAEITDEIYRKERHEINAMRAAFYNLAEPTDIVLWPSAPTTAPAGLEWTGDRRFIAPWTALGGPVVSMPSGFGAGEMPIGMLLAGAPGYDRHMAEMAPRLAAAVPQTA